MIKKQTKLWTTRDGRRIRICDMTDDHLENTIRYLERAANISLLASHPEFKGEQAQIQAEGEWDRLLVRNEPSDFYPIYGNMQLERERRREQ